MQTPQDTTTSNNHDNPPSTIRGRSNDRKPSFRSERKHSLVLRMSEKMGPSRASTFGSDDFDTQSRVSTASSTAYTQSEAQTQAAKPKKAKKPRAKSQTFSDVGRHSNQWLFNDMSLTDAVKTLFGKK